MARESFNSDIVRAPSLVKVALPVSKLIEYDRFETTGPLWLAAYCGVSPSAPPLLMRACAPVMKDLSSISFTSGIGVSLNSAGYCWVAMLPNTGYVDRKLSLVPGSRPNKIRLSARLLTVD